MFPLSREEFSQLSHAVTLLGMSGVGKTVFSAHLRKSDNWFHYSADYRIGTRYLAEEILDNIKLKIMQMQDPFVADLLVSDSIYISHNIAIDNLTPVLSFLGMYGDPGHGGMDKKTFLHRQHLYRMAETHSMLDVGRFMERAWQLYGCKHFVNDASGSLCEVVDVDDPDDAVLKHLGEHTAIVFIKPDDATEEALKARAVSAPKPLYYQPDFIAPFLEGMPDDGAGVEPTAFAKPLFRQLLDFRKPRYAQIADAYGFTIEVGDILVATAGENTGVGGRFINTLYDGMKACYEDMPATRPRTERYLAGCHDRTAVHMATNKGRHG